MPLTKWCDIEFISICIWEAWWDYACRCICKYCWRVKTTRIHWFVTRYETILKTNIDKICRNNNWNFVSSYKVKFTRLKKFDKNILIEKISLWNYVVKEQLPRQVIRAVWSWRGLEVESYGKNSHPSMHSPFAGKSMSLQMIFAALLVSWAPGYNPILDKNYSWCNKIKCLIYNGKFNEHKFIIIAFRQYVTYHPRAIWIVIPFCRVHVHQGFVIRINEPIIFQFVLKFISSQQLRSVITHSFSRIQHKFLANPGSGIYLF